MLKLKKSLRRSPARKRPETPPSVSETEQPIDKVESDQDQDSGFEPHRDSVHWDSGKQVGHKI